MTEKKRPYPKAGKPEMDMDDMEMPEMEPPGIGGMCPMMYGHQAMCPMMCPMMQMMNSEEQRMEMEDMRSPDWYEENDGDYSSDESDEYPEHCKYGNMYKYKWPPYPVFCPPFCSGKPYKKKYKK